MLLKNDLVNHGYVGAYIFLAGMVIEQLVSVIEGRHLVKKLPAKKEDHPVVHRYFNENNHCAHFFADHSKKRKSTIPTKLVNQAFDEKSRLFFIFD
ncbi:hypothetical protein [Bacillus sp. FJAT-50079]|uniref:hypothetical protein n=1 Tax=Bacillus sp. FJAT-50079 TaxID=2833577 RepID=UPI001BC9A9F2|nr:hypothetical protein [Bacillus sp. FJAT-50079]MBS4208454.1 hypothetical protein [Bacillus sp. FJAT-50079]